MADLMRPIPFGELLTRIMGEFRNHDSIFSIDKAQFYKDDRKKTVNVFSQSCTTPMGPAAGPHTQLSQNIVASYLVGARFIELKTVQIMDHLEIAKPCIDARDEGYNVEWSTEYTLEKAYDEYLKAWIVLHMIESAMEGKVVEKPSFIFNMSCGYNLEGIKQEKMQIFIDSMIDAGKKPLFDEYINEAKALLDEGILEGSDWEGREECVRKTLDKISRNICPSVTVSTMHGCPPKEIEAICSYLLTEKKLDTFVKLNPTLLGYDTVRKVLDDLGFNYVVLKRESFEHDLQLSDAKAMLHRLVELAGKEGRKFGVKLTNTLGNVNPQDVLPGDERYGSGRILLPLSTRVALILSEEFNGTLPISYSGGVSALSVKELFEIGIHPITLATDMLHPGGYAKMKQLCEICKEAPEAWKKETIDVSRLRKFVETVSSPKGIAGKEFRGTNSAKVGTPLSLFDCYVAPCVEACPIHQPIPEYVALAGEGRLAEALSLIYTSNALPNITGWICDHQCQNHCTRMDYEGPVQIREVKRIAAEKGFDEFKASMWEKPDEPADVKAAVIGAGPAGLAAAYFLALAGFDTSVFEKEKNAGGVVANIIPEFRIPLEAVEKDVQFIKDNGVKFNFGTEKTIKELRDEGFEYIFVGVGATASNDPHVSGNGPRESAISFLLRSKNGEKINLGKNVVVVGGGNTAMDAARMAIRTQGVESVTVVYRRSQSEMPADREEYEMALSDGVKFLFLANPSDVTDGIMNVKKMVLGEKDASGRRKPVESGETFTLDCSYMISAIGEKADQNVLDAIGVGEEGKVYIIGDTKTGPSTVVRCIASAQSAVDDAIDKVYEDILSQDDDEKECDCEGECTCSSQEEEVIEEDEDIDEIRSEEDDFFASIREKKSSVLLSASKTSKDFLKTEAKRCLECSYYCNKCTEVCPNRANVMLDMRDTGLFDDPFQILHLDAYCNECGNCAAFCPHDGGPYLKKFTLFSRPDDFENSTNSGFYCENDQVKIRLDGKIIDGEIDKDGKLVADVPEEVKAMVETVFVSYSYLLGPVEE
ncbi:MAG: putative selenate reductase subunit YgfK [Candidatus Ornithospirochaeta sp.]